MLMYVNIISSVFVISPWVVYGAQLTYSHCLAKLEREIRSCHLINAEIMKRSKKVSHHPFLVKYENTTDRMKMFVNTLYQYV